MAPGRTTSTARAGTVLVTTAVVVVSLSGCVGLTSESPPHPCDHGASELERLPAAPFTGEPPAEIVQWQVEAGEVREHLDGIAGDRLAGTWVVWEPEPGLVVSVTRGPELPALDAAAEAAEIPVEVRYTATASEQDLLAAGDRVGEAVWEVPGTGGVNVDVVNSRLLVAVASGEDGAAERCARLQGVLADIGVPYAFEVFEGSVERTRRGPVPLSRAATDSSRTVYVGVPSCNGDAEVTSLAQSDDEVRLEVTTTYPAPGWGGDGCADSIDVLLDAPLGDRTLIDESTGEPITVTVH